MLDQRDVVGGFEIIIADGQSDDGTRDVLARMTGEDDRIRVIENPGRIVSTGLNLAIEASRGQIIVRMDTHTEYAPDYVRECLHALESSGAQNVGGPAMTRFQGYMQGAIAAAFHSPLSTGGSRFHDPDFEGWVDTVTYGCWRKETLVRLGLFDEALVRNQDDELNLRLIRSGGRVWQTPRIRSWYYPRGTLSALFMQYAQYGYWKVAVIRKHRVPASPRHLVPGLFVAVVIALALLSLVWPIALVAVGVLVVSYAVVLVVGSVMICRGRRNLRYLPVMPVVLCSYHLGYGVGFLIGLVVQVLLRSRSPGVFSRLTR